MNSIADIKDYRRVAATSGTTPHWLMAVSHIVENRQQDHETIGQLLTLLSELTELRNISIAVPDSPSRFRARYSSSGVTDGIYSFAVQHALCRQFGSGEWLTIKEGEERSDAFVPSEHTLTDKDRCLLMPLTLRGHVLASLVMDVRYPPANLLDVGLVNFIGTQIAAVLATQVVPNFVTLYARPYQRVQDNDLDDIQQAIDKCNGNKTMAAKVLGLTPRQLRYRLAKLCEAS